MSAEKTPALVIRQADFSESSRVVTLFTRNFGKVAALAKGAKRLKGPFDSALDLLSLCEVVILRKSSASLDILTEAKLSQRFKPRQGDLVSLYGGYYVAELLDALSEPYDSHPGLFDEACAALDALAGERHLFPTILRFELVILREIGQLPTFDACVACGTPLGSGRQFTYKVTQGGLICQQCLIEDSPRSWITPAAARLLRDWSAEPMAAAEPPDATTATWQEAQRHLHTTFTHILGRRPKMARYLPF
ncbi:MAG: DNA repair protein RecO [Planctomycetaceae bacterium]